MIQPNVVHQSLAHMTAFGFMFQKNKNLLLNPTQKEPLLGKKNYLPKLCNQGKNEPKSKMA